MSQTYDPQFSHRPENKLPEVHQLAGKMSIWMRLLGTFFLLCGVGLIFTLIGVLFAWIPLWIGLILLQAAGKAERAESWENTDQLMGMLEKLRLYFLVSSALAVLLIAFVLVFIYYFRNYLDRYSTQLMDLVYLYL